MAPGRFEDVSNARKKSKSMESVLGCIRKAIVGGKHFSWDLPVEKRSNVIYITS